MTENQIRQMVGEVAANGSTGGAIADALVVEVHALRAELDTLARALASQCACSAKLIAERDRLVGHIRDRLALLSAMIPCDEKAKTVKFARTNELVQLLSALAEGGQ